MEPATPSPAGYLQSLRSLGDGLLASVQERLELFSVELQEEKFRLILTFVWISSAIFAGMMTLAFASLTAVYLFWETARLPALAGLTVIYGASLATIIVLFRRFIARQPGPFAATREEIGKDRACIHNGS